MSGKGKKLKGSVFERLVAKKIIAAANVALEWLKQPAFGRKDCYRTPLSGGHEFAGESDLIISPELERHFSFCVECKHRKNFRLDHVFDLVKDFVGYHEQVLDACKREGFRRNPMVVIRGNGGRVYAAAPENSVTPFFLKDVTSMKYLCCGHRWVMADMDSMLTAIFAKSAAEEFVKEMN